MLMVNQPVIQRRMLRPRRKTSEYSRDVEHRVESILAELYDVLGIQKPDDLYGSVVIEARYQNGKPIGQVDVNVRYVLKRGRENDAR